MHATGNAVIVFKQLTPAVRETTKNRLLKSYNSPFRVK